MAVRRAVTRAAKSDERWPGEPGMWIFLCGDLLIFSALFIAFVFVGTQEPDAFAAGRAALNMQIGLVNTVILLTSSWFAFLGLSLHRQGKTGAGTAALGATALCGAAFVILKIIEYAQKAGEGFYPSVSPFFMYYYALTGLHLFHVIVAISAMVFATFFYRKQPNWDRHPKSLEAVCLLWHLIDLAWIYLYAIIYLMERAPEHV